MRTFLQTLFFFLLAVQIGFAQWYQQQYSDTTINLYSVYFVDSNIGFAVADDEIILGTTNGGDIWDKLAGGGPTAEGISLFDVYFFNYQDGIAVGGWDNGSNQGGVILVTIGSPNGWIGYLWPEELLSVSCIDNNIGWATGKNGTILKTTDGGTTWTPQISGTTETLYDVSYTDMDNGVVVGSNGLILKTTNGGTTWTPQISGTTETLYDVSFTDMDNGVVVGSNGLILKTTNGGTTWISQLSGTTNDLFAVSLVDEKYGTAVGYDWNNSVGIILRTSDGGTSWFSQISSTANALQGVYFTDALSGWAVGENGTILHTTNGGVTFVEEEQIDEIPTEFLLSQNYPNPFNPSTKIKYSIPQLSNVVIKVFDVLGNEIETLVNEEKPAGTYELTWNAESLPSGVYFYQLKTGSFVEMKKMILMK